MVRGSMTTDNKEVRSPIKNVFSRRPLGTPGGRDQFTKITAMIKLYPDCYKFNLVFMFPWMDDRGNYHTGRLVHISTFDATSITAAIPMWIDSLFHLQNR